MAKRTWFSLPPRKNDHEDSDDELEDGEPPMTEEKDLERALQLSREEEEAKWVVLWEAMEVSQSATAAPPPPPQEGDETLPPPQPTAGVWRSP
jgi:hypothetical protein